MTTTPWMTDARPQWLEDVTAWIHDATAAKDLGTVTDISTVHERVWSAVLRVTTTKRILHFKAEGLGGMHEPVVIAFLADRWPDVAPTILRMDATRPWFLMGDDGEPMRGTVPGPRQVEALERLLPAYAEMQRDSHLMVDRWIELGVPDRRLAVAPHKLARILEDRSLPFTDEQHAAVSDLLPAFGDICEELSAIPPALDHGDLHSLNVLVRGDEQRIIDWGDSCVTHPFCSLFPMFQLAIPWMEDVDRGAAARRLRDAYLGSWKVDRDALSRVLWTGHVTRAFDHYEMLDGMDEVHTIEWKGDVVELLVLWSERYRAMCDDTIIDVLVNANPV